MSKFSIGKHGIIVETHEKNNVMSPANNMAWLILPLSFLGMILVSNVLIKVLCTFIFCVYIFIWLVIFCAHSVKSPQLLQSETFRIEAHKIEAGMIENGKEKLTNQDTLTSNIDPALPYNETGDMDE